MVGHEGSSAGSYLADPTSPIPSHCASIVTTSIVRVNKILYVIILHKLAPHNPIDMVLLWEELLLCVSRTLRMSLLLSLIPLGC